MKITVPVWNDAVSPVFDASRQWRTFTVDLSGSVLHSQDTGIDVADFSQRILYLNRLETEVLICGAVSEPFAQMIMASGIEIVPFITGPVDDVLQAYLEARLSDEKYMLPGCFRGGRRRRRRRGAF